MIYDHKLLGGVVDPAQAWFNHYQDGAWHEIGDGNWRVSCTPTTPGLLEVRAHLKNRLGENGNSRLYYKVRLVQLTPVYNNALVLYSEAMWEGAAGYGDQVRFLDAPVTPFIVVNVPTANVGLVHTFSIDHLACAGTKGEVGYGSILMVRD